MSSRAWPFLCRGIMGGVLAKFLSRSGQNAVGRHRYPLEQKNQPHQPHHTLFLSACHPRCSSLPAFSPFPSSFPPVPSRAVPSGYSPQSRQQGRLSHRTTCTFRFRHIRSLILPPLLLYFGHKRLTIPSYSNTQEAPHAGFTIQVYNRAIELRPHSSPGISPILRQLP